MLGRLTLVVSLFALAMSAWPQAQEGHPLVGTWTGTWGPDATQRHHVTLVLNWDGTAITGTINPGVDQAPLQAASLDPATWTLRFDAGERTAADVTPIAAEGRLENLGSTHRQLRGRWTQGDVTGDFLLTRE